MQERNYSRLPIHLEATITYNGTIVEGELDNISLKGVFVRTGQKIPMNDLITITIYHHTKDQQICSLKGRVVRITPDGAAVEFEKTLLD
ncbi:PilZ domain-containing protein [Geobacter pelophilus]|uniref:PilZ domain-containing protein n=1 Tax=Geoanaerobacter pelophilus TaxID=60036 RepID=A0AAW4LAF5_9BACT|nr:PilZ domain-containing protein [Geoanaerobacter pelophilus]MBT0665316.1 PilZ domain-containing protein [Geoanaerobacter pelophilus]